MPSGIRTRTSGIVVNINVEPPSGFDSATTAWVAAVVADGGAVSATQKSRVNDLIVGLKADNLFSILDRLWLYGGESDSHQAKIDIIATQSLTVYGSPTLGAGGYTGDTATAALDTILIPSAGGVNYTLNSACYGCYHRTHSGDGTCIMGTTTGANARMHPHPNGAPEEMRYFIDSSNTHDVAVATTLGIFIASRTSANDVALYRNGASVHTDAADAVAAVPNQSLGVLARHDGAGNNFSGYTGSEISAAWLGAGLDATQASNLSSRINTYATAWGFNTY